jgi:hypothetical protein
MVGFITIVKLSAKNKIEKWQPFEVEADANSHAAEYGGFVVPAITGRQKYWIIDPVGKTLTFDQAQYDSDIASAPENSAIRAVSTKNNKTIRDALWELHQAVTGAITLPDETKGEYSTRLKDMRKAYE